MPTRSTEKSEPRRKSPFLTPADLEAARREVQSTVVLNMRRDGRRWVLGEIFEEFKQHPLDRPLPERVVRRIAESGDPLALVGTLREAKRYELPYFSHTKPRPTVDIPVQGLVTKGDRMADAIRTTAATAGQIALVELPRVGNAFWRITRDVLSRRPPEVGFAMPLPQRSTPHADAETARTGREIRARSRVIATRIAEAQRATVPEHGQELIVGATIQVGCVTGTELFTPAPRLVTAPQPARERMGRAIPDSFTETSTSPRSESRNLLGLPDPVLVTVDHEAFRALNNIFLATVKAQSLAETLRQIEWATSEDRELWKLMKSIRGKVSQAELQVLQVAWNSQQRLALMSAALTAQLVAGQYAIREAVRVGLSTEEVLALGHLVSNFTIGRITESRPWRNAKPQRMTALLDSKAILTKLELEVNTVSERLEQLLGR